MKKFRVSVPLILVALVCALLIPAMLTSTDQSDATSSEDNTTASWMLSSLVSEALAAKRGTWKCQMSCVHRYNVPYKEGEGPCDNSKVNTQVKKQYAGTQNDSSTMRAQIRKDCEKVCNAGGGKDNCLCTHDGCHFCS
jgi:hypothetical protein